MRHAKSDWGTPGERDLDRPLAKRGQRDAPRMGKWLRAQGLVPDLVLASPARRAQETASKVCKALDIGTQAIQWEPRIYDATGFTSILKVFAYADAVVATYRA